DRSRHSLFSRGRAPEPQLSQHARTSPLAWAFALGCGEDGKADPRMVRAKRQTIRSRNSTQAHAHARRDSPDHRLVARNGDATARRFQKQAVYLYKRL